MVDLSADGMDQRMYDGVGYMRSGGAVKRTVYLPDDLAGRVEAYLREHRSLTFSTLVQEALEHRLTPPDPRAVLDLAGLVPEASTPARQRAEDRVVHRER
jgi:hypothetical protein